MNGPFRKEVTVNIDQGLHMIPCSRIAQIVRESKSHVKVILDEKVADAREVLDLMMLNAELGTLLLIESEGDGAEETLARLVQLFKDDFELPSDH